jgi:hypothetical protein
MSIRKELINLTIINNSNSNFTIPLFQNGVATINATTKYSYDITSASLACGQGNIIINGVLYNFTYDTNVSAVATALTNLGYGFFSYEIIGLNTYIYVVDNTNVYGDMNLCLAGTTTTTTTTSTSTTSTTTTDIPTTTTTTSTTTTTTTASLQYLTDQYVCGTCTLIANNVVVQSNFSLDILDYFIGEDGNVYQILGSTSGVPVTNISDNTAYVDCPSVPCPATTTTTTTTSTTTSTTTLAPTTTTTSTTTSTTTLAPTTTTTSTTTTTTTILPYNIFLDMSLSVDTTVSQITVQGNPVTYVGGATLPNTGGSNSNLNTTDVGGSQNLVITYSCSFSGHKITLTDSLGTITCQNTGVGTNITMSFPTTNISNISLVTILVEDGTC